MAEGSVGLCRIAFTDPIPNLSLIKQSGLENNRVEIKAVNFCQDAKRLYSVDRYGIVAEWSGPGLEKIRLVQTGLSGISAAKFFARCGAAGSGWLRKDRKL